MIGGFVLLIINKELEQVVLVLVCEVLDLDAVLRELGQLQQALLEFARLLGILLNLLVLLLVHDLVLQAPLHDAFPDLLDALDEQALELILLTDFVDFFEAGPFGLHALLMDGRLQVPDRLIVVGFQQ